VSDKKWEYLEERGDWAVRGSYDEPDNLQFLYRGEVFRTLTCPGYQIWNWAAHLQDNIPALEEALAADVVFRAKAALEDVTAGPWVARAESDGDYPIYADGGPIFGCPDCGVRGGAGRADAEFIAAARSLVPELVAELERLRAEMQSALDEGDWA